MKKSIVRIENLSHRYATSWAIRDISFEISQNGVLGLLGSNGAGKSTTMNILCGVVNQTEGSVSIAGIDMRRDPEGAKKQIGFLPQTPPLYMELTVDEYLAHCAHLRLIDSSKIKSAVAEAKERCDIAHFSKRLIGNLSGGYKQRVGIAQAIIHQPKLVVLDEPTNGLDPNQITGVRSLIRDIAMDRAVIFSSHILSEVQLLCRDVIMIEQGKVVFADTMDSFNNYIEPHSMVLHLEQPPAKSELLQITGVTRVDVLSDRKFRVYFDGDHEIAKRLVAASVHQGWDLLEINLDKSSIGEVFAQLSNKSVQNQQAL
jgi:ABC-2 type transport system ATP-binding protein